MRVTTIPMTIASSQLYKKCSAAVYPPSRARLFSLVSVVLLLSGCFMQPDDVAMVKKFRVMAVSVNPPELRPDNQTETTVTVLWRDPKGNNRPVSFAWVVCQGKVDATSGYQYCALLDPALAPVVTDASDSGDRMTIPPVPEAAFAEIAAGETVDATVIVLACAGGTLPAAEQLLNHRDDPDIAKLCAGGDGIAAYKTIQIANGNEHNDAPNAVPVIQSVRLDGQLLISNEAATEDVTPDNFADCSTSDCETESMELEVTFTAESFQQYTEVIFDEPEIRHEYPAVYWFITGGELLTPYTSSSGPDDPAIAEWIPKKPGQYTLFAVANDNRGGISWQTFEIEIR